jgi:hypothetical protein
VAHGRPDTVSLLGAAVEAAVDQAISPSLEHLVPLTQFYVLRSASLSQSPHSLLETGDLVFMASTRCQPITHNHPDESTFGLDFQFSKPPNPTDASRLGSAARFILSAMDVPAAMDNRGFGAPRAGGQVLSSAKPIEPSKGGDRSHPRPSKC